MGGGAGADSPFAISPDGRMAVTFRQVGGFTGDLWLRDLTRGTETRLTSTNVVGASPVWSPDGARIAFPAKYGSSFDLYSRDVGSNSETAVLKTSRDKYLSDWSPDGNVLLYSEIDPDTKSDLWYVPLDGGSRVPIAFARSKFVESSGRFSPDGRWVA